MASLNSLLLRFGPGLLGGITLGDWLRLLRDNEFAIDRPYWWRAAVISLASLGNSVVRWLENSVYGQEVNAVHLQPPIFVLGIWRSGTTHLHNLLTVDDRFAFPNLYHVLNPHTFLLTEATGSKLFAGVVPERRPQDNMGLSFQAPAEDEFALCAATGLSMCLSWMFFRRAAHYDRYLTFRGVAKDEIARWEAALKWFVKKLAWKYGKPLVLKSPGHTARIRLLVDLFPNAKFVHIHRNPYTVFHSAKHTALKVIEYWALQRAKLDEVEDRTIRQYKEVYEAFFEDRSLIPQGHFHEVCFEELETDPIGQMRRTYEALELPDFAHVEPDLQAYLESLKGYKKNTFPDLPTDLGQRIAREWRRSFDEWGYSV